MGENNILVCSTRTGLLFMMTREEREMILIQLMEVQEAIGSYVVKSFGEQATAMKFMAEQNKVDALLENIFEKD